MVVGLRPLCELRFTGPSEWQLSSLAQAGLQLRSKPRSWVLNGAPAARIEIDGQLAAVSLAVENGKVTQIYAVANPQRLTRLDEEAELAR